MKRIMALFVALLMLMSVVSVAFAQDADPEAISEDPAEVPTDAPLCADADFTCGMCYEENEGQYLLVSMECPLEDGAEVTDEADETADETAEVTEEDAAEEDEETVDEAVVEEIVGEDTEEEAGITPDRPVLWGLERAMERISLALTLGKSAKAQKGLAHAQERLAEVQMMIAQKKLDKAERAMERHRISIEGVEESVEGMDGENEPEAQLEEQAQIEAQLEAQEQEMEQVRDRARTRLQLTEEQKAQIDALVADLKEDIGDAKVKVEVRKNKVKIAIQAKTGKSAEEVDEMGDGIKAQIRVKNQEKKQTSKPNEGLEVQQQEQIQEQNEGEDSQIQQQTQEEVNVGGAVSIGKPKGKTAEAEE